MEVWICDPNSHKILWTFALNFANIIINTLRSYVKNLKSVSLDSKHFKVG